MAFLLPQYSPIVYYPQSPPRIFGTSDELGNHGDRNGGHLIGYGGLISVPVAQ